MLYPINLEIKDMKITIIGGGDVAYRKCKNFLEFGKSVRVVSPEFIDSFELIKNNVELIYDLYKEEYIKDSFIVVAATNNKEINKNIVKPKKDNYEEKSFHCAERTLLSGTCCCRSDVLGFVCR